VAGRAGHPRGAELDELLTQTGRGSTAAFEQLYDAVAGSAYGVALRVVRDPAMAEDVAQEALLEVWRHAARFSRTSGSARSWILSIAHRRAVDRVRSEQAHTNRLKAHTDAAQASAASDDEPVDQVVDTLYAQWEAARLRAGMATLTELQREALQLTYFKGFTHREVSESLGVPLGTAKARVRDGLIKLRDVLEVDR
jgi:RNA polymerase sigma-70 factor (ECF subfamily)